MHSVLLNQSRKSYYRGRPCKKGPEVSVEFTCVPMAHRLILWFTDDTPQGLLTLRANECYGLEEQ